MNCQSVVFGCIAALWCMSGLGRELELTAPPPGDDTLYCSAMFDKYPGFATDRHSVDSDEYPNGFIDIGLNHEYVRLRSAPGAGLALGGEFTNTIEPVTVIQIKPIKVIELYDGRQEGPSQISLSARFIFTHGEAKRRFTAKISCAVYDLESYYQNLCTNAPAKKSLVCGGLRRFLQTKGSVP